MSNPVYRTHLQNKRDDTCPITLEQQDTLDTSKSITFVTSSRPAHPDEIDELKKTYPILNEKCTIHYTSTFDLESAYTYIVQYGNLTNPISRTPFTSDDVKRVTFRYENKDILSKTYDKDELIARFIAYLNDVVDGSFRPTDENYKILQCHLTADTLSNFLNVDRIGAENLLNMAQIQKLDVAWIMRPSSFKGYDFGIDQNDKFYPMSEHYSISFITHKNEIHHMLIEKLFSKTYFHLYGGTFGNCFESNRESITYITFMDALHTVFINDFKNELDVLKINIPENNLQQN